MLEVPPSISRPAARVDFRPFVGHGIDAIIVAIVRSFSSAVADGEWTPATLQTNARAWRSQLPWLIEEAKRLGRSLKFLDFDAVMMSRYAEYLRTQRTYSSAATSFASFATGLRRLAALGYIDSASSILPSNPFPGAQSTQKHTPPYSIRERNALIRCLANDYRQVVAGGFEERHNQQCQGLVVCMLLIAFHSGFNLTTLLELRRDALRPHPIKPGMLVLQGFKRRAQREVASIAAPAAPFSLASTDLASVFASVLRITAPRIVGVPDLKDHLFVVGPHGDLPGRPRGGSSPLQEKFVSLSLHAMAARYAIPAEGGEGLLRLSLRRIRATLAARAMELSKGDPLVVASVLGNEAHTAQISYMTPDFDAPALFARAADALVNRLETQDRSAAVPTPVGACTDPLFGRFAPQDGITYCERWLSCFRCPNQCLTADEEDLWRLYSFYWVLQAESKRLKSAALGGLVRFVIHILNVVLPEQFGNAASRARERARGQPHPFWTRVRALDALDIKVIDAAVSAS